MLKRFISLFSFCIFLAAHLSAGMLSLDDTALKILKESPGFKSQDLSLEASSASLSTEANLPDPEISGEYLVMPEDVVNRWALELSWDLEWPGVYGSRKNEAKAKLYAAKKAVAMQRAEALAEIKDLLLDYIRSAQKIRLLEELSQNNDSIYRLAEQAARGGEMTILDLNKVKLEYANIRVGMAALKDEQAETVANLAEIYGGNPDPLLQQMKCEFPAVVIPDPRDIDTFIKNAPAVQNAQAEVEIAKSAKKVATMEALPSISVGYKHAYEDWMHFNGATFGISVPIFSSHGKQKEAKAAIKEAEFNAEATTLKIDSEISASLNRLSQIVEQINEIAPIVENLDYNSALLKAYKGGVITLIEYISDRNYFTTAAIELVSLRHNAAKTLAFLQRYSNSGF